MKKSYFYADAQPLCQYKHTVDELQQPVADVSFYVHDRLGSIRLVIVPVYDELTDTWSVSVANSYTYTPFGGFYDGEEPLGPDDNPFKFTGQWHDAEIDQYYLRARMYDPAMMRFTSRDPVRGKFRDALTLHRYLYCLNDSINKQDLSGRLGENLTGAIYGGYAMHAAAIGTAAYGVATGNDYFLNAGIAMEVGIAIGMTIGAVLEDPQLITKAINLYAAVSVLSLIDQRQSFLPSDDN